MADFGISKNLDGTALGTHRIGTPGYMAPEQLDETSGDYTAAVDVFALGAVAFSLRTGKPPFKSSYELFEYSRDPGKFPTDALDYSTVICSKFIRAVMAKEPGQRLSIDSVLAHPWLVMNRQEPSR